jgi:N-acyl-D-amino-acid deacylase
MYDLLLLNACIVDGTGSRPYYADIGIADGRIVKIGTVKDAAREVYDVSGKMVTPGFIDMHSHSDLIYLGDRVSGSKVRQGITTELIGQDGLGVAPVDDEDKSLMMELTNGLLGYMPAHIWQWNGFGEYLKRLESASLPCNLAVLVSHGAARVKAMKMARRKPSAAELSVMKYLVDEAMTEGAFGLSTGLIYPPCSYSEPHEITELLKVIAPYSGIYVVHQRDEGYHLVRSFEEVSGEAKEAGVHLHISHLQAYGRVNWPLMDILLEKANALMAEGQKITWDRYPYMAGCTVLTAVLPDWVLSEGTRALISNLKDPEYRERIRREYDKGLDVWNNRSISVGWDNIVVSGVRSAKNKWMEQKDCLSLAKSLGKDPVDFVCDLLAEEELAVTMISHYGSPDVLEKVLCHPSATLGTDGIYCGSPHPRLYGSYPRFLEDFVLKRAKLDWPTAIRKITGHPADILGLKDRGVVGEGLWADLVVIEPERLSDLSSYEEPSVYPSGIDLVIVNGRLVVGPTKGLTGVFPGQVLRK